MSKTSTIFCFVWLSLWTVGAFVGVTQLFLLPEDPPLVQTAILTLFTLGCALAWTFAFYRLVRSMAKPSPVATDPK